MRRGLSVVSLVFVLGFSIARAGDATSSPSAADLRTLGESDNQVMSHLDYLTNKIGPRLTGSHNIERAYEWTANEFRRFGLKNVHTETWGEWAVYFDRGTMSGKILTDDGERSVVFGTHAWTAGTNGPVRGPVFYYPRNKEELDAIDRSTLKNAWLLMRGSGRGTNQKDREAIRKELDDAGIAGVLRNVGEDLILTDGSPGGVTMKKIPTRVSVNMKQKDWKELARRVDKDEKVEVELDIQNKFSEGPAQNKDVIAEIPGTDKADEIVIVGGHLDSWDVATGATDNGTGVATTLEAARLLAKAGAKPRRTIRFILWSGEEQGLFGSAWYVKKHKDELAKVSCILIHDGGTNYVSGINVTPAMKPIMEPALEALNFDPKMKFKVHEAKHLPYGVGSDHDSFLAVGVPGFFWNQVGKQNYDHEHHTQYDTFEAAVPEYQKHSAIVIAQGALAIANLDAMLPRADMLAPMMRGQQKMLGVSCDPELTIQHVVDGSLAEGAGLMEGDKLLELGGTKITNLEELRAAVQAAKGQVTVKFVRDGKELEVKVTFEEPKKEPPKKRWL